MHDGVNSRKSNATTLKVPYIYIRVPYYMAEPATPSVRIMMHGDRLPSLALSFTYRPPLKPTFRPASFGGEISEYI